MFVVVVVVEKDDLMFRFLLNFELFVFVDFVVVHHQLQLQSLANHLLK